MKGAILSVLASTLTLGASAAFADYEHHGHKDRYRYNHKDVQAYFDCAWTPAARFEGTITDAVVATAAGDSPEFTVLLTAVLAAGLEGVLAGEGPFTVYAPTDAAFGAVPEPLVGLLLSDPTGLLTDVLAYHVVTEKSKRTDPRRVYRSAREVETFNGQSVFLSRNGGPQVNGSEVACTPVKTSNGVIYVIDSVLLPQFLQPEQEQEPEPALKH